jgi:hypothetical protein
MVMSDDKPNKIYSKLGSQQKEYVFVYPPRYDPPL